MGIANARISAVVEAIAIVVVDRTPETFEVSENAPSSGHQVEDQDRERNHEQQVNQAARDVEAEAQEPQKQNEYENCPKHIHLASALPAPGTCLDTRNAFTNGC